jgi:hypothetical protein
MRRASIIMTSTAQELLNDPRNHPDVGRTELWALQSGRQGGFDGVCPRHRWHRSEDKQARGVDHPGANAAGAHQLREHSARAGAKLKDVVDVLVLLARSTDFAGLNEEYAKFFPTDPPARAVAKLGMEVPSVLVSIKMTAVL